MLSVMKTMGSYLALERTSHSHPTQPQLGKELGGAGAEQTVLANRQDKAPSVAASSPHLMTIMAISFLTMYICGVVWDQSGGPGNFKHGLAVTII